jgi:acetyl esterase/lipase
MPWRILQIFFLEDKKMARKFLSSAAEPVVQTKAGRLRGFMLDGILMRFKFFGFFILGFVVLAACSTGKGGVISSPVGESMDFSNFTVGQWFNYEQYIMFSTVNSDFTSYDDYEVAGPLFWELYAAVGNVELPESEKRKALQSYHDILTAINPIRDVERERIYLWNEENIPTTTAYTENTDYQYVDAPGFHPYMLYIPAQPGTRIKGAVILCSGGSFLFRNNIGEGMQVAEELSKLGYHCFVVNYRVNPYSVQEGALDLARAVRAVRSRAGAYGIDANDIAVMGFSAGGILCGEMLLDFGGLADGSAIDPRYVPDELDKVSADASAVGMVYSFYGALSFASTDVAKFRASNLPPAFFVYGTEDPLADQFEACADALQEAGIAVESVVLQGWAHGFGAADGKWVLDFDTWLAGIFEK